MTNATQCVDYIFLNLQAKVWILRAVQQPGTYRYRFSALKLVGLKPTQS